MVKRRGDKTPEPLGGRVAERLRLFEQARQPDLQKNFTSQAKPMKTRGKKSERQDEDKARRKDR